MSATAVAPFSIAAVLSAEPLNTLLPAVVTVFGIVIVVSAVVPSNAL